MALENVNQPERIDRLVYQKDDSGENVKDNIYYNGPTEFLVSRICQQLLLDPVWKTFFGENIDPYKRMDYGLRQLPAMRVYNETFTRDYENWFVEGSIKVDIIFPASLRRKETQQIQDTLTSAVLQQFSRPQFFDTLNSLVPGLNELGKKFDVDKSLGFVWDENEAPLTQITLNFRLDLREWQRYLEQTNRTKDSPFEEVLADLKKIETMIIAYKDDIVATENKLIEVDVTQKV